MKAKPTKKHRQKVPQKVPQKTPKVPSEILPALLYPAKSKSEEAWKSKLIREGRIRKIAPRLYTSLPASKTASAVRANWSEIVSELFPSALLSHRSALEYKPSPTHELILTGTTNRKLELPGLTLTFVRGPQALEDDSQFRSFRVSSTPRALLESLSTSKSTAHRSLTPNDLEKRLEEILKIRGVSELNTMRDRARQIARQLGWQREFQKLDTIVGALLGTRESSNLITASGRARALGKPYDSERAQRFDILFAELMSRPLPEIKDEYAAKDHIRNKAFFEAYFSNYIEGTIFEIEEAEEIVFDRKIPATRPRDAHDILGTYEIVSDMNEMTKTPRNTDELEEFIRTRHKALLSQRPDASPGEYKSRPNRAGDTLFVDPGLITGTLNEGFVRYEALPRGLPRAIFMMFIIAEVHPFTDGNGRISRIMMNAELVSQGFSTIIIPNVYREDYLSALRALTRRDRPDPLIRMLTRAQRFSHFEFSPYKKILAHLESRNWFREPTEAKIVEN
jgi:hypothetical protein